MPEWCCVQDSGGHKDPLVSLKKKRKEGRREGGAFSKLSSLEAENSCDRKWIRRSLQVLFHEVCLFSRSCCLCCEEALCEACWLQGRTFSGHQLHWETAMVKGTVIFASLLKRDSRAHAPNIEPKPKCAFHKTRPSRLLVGRPL